MFTGNEIKSKKLLGHFPSSITANYSYFTLNVLIHNESTANWKNTKHRVD